MHAEIACGVQFWMQGSRVSVTTRFNVAFLPLRSCYENTHTCFSKDAENLTTYGYVL